MKPNQPNNQLSPHIQSRLGWLRFWIRVYLLVLGAALCVVWLGLTFWLFLPLDYLPVIVGATEMPVAARAVMLVFIIGVLGFILYWWIFRRIFVPMANHSMAILLERQFGDLHDSLMTSVEMSEHPDHADEFNRQMLERARAEADQRIHKVSISRVFDYRPLAYSSAGAVVLMLTILVFFLLNSSAMATWASRLYLLSPEPWERSAKIEVVGIETPRSLLFARDEDASTIRPFPDDTRSLKVARGSSVVLHVRADAAKYVPDTCRVEFSNKEDSGRPNMNKIGAADGGWQAYRFDNKPLKAITQTTKFDVVGYDHRVSGYRLEVVDSPAIIETELRCEFPEYMVDNKKGLWLPRTLDLASAKELPVGAKIVINMTANKELTDALIEDSNTGESYLIDVVERGGDQARLRYTVNRLSSAGLSLKIELRDADGVTSDKPHLIQIAGRDDSPPVIDVALRGVSTVITPSARIPAIGKIVDDYGVAEAWFEVTLPGDTQRHKHPVKLGAGGSVDEVDPVDFQRLRARDDDPIVLEPGDKIVFAAKALDRYNLSPGDEGQLGEGDSYQLDVVTPQQLLAMLEARELGLRRSFEQIIDEVTGTRDSLLRVKASASGEEEPLLELGDLGEEPEDDAEIDPAAQQQRERAQRLWRLQRAVQATRKSAQETLGVAAAFRDIREELDNNRVLEAEDRKQRLEELIGLPLKRIGEVRFPSLIGKLEDLEKRARQIEDDPEMVQPAIDEMNNLLVEMDGVLHEMLEMETFNELVDIVRSLIDENEKLIQETKKEQENQALDLLQ